MSLSLTTNCHSADILSEDVLVEIFSYLDGDELLALEVVCRKWHHVINNLMNWDKVFRRKVHSCPVWCDVWVCPSVNATDVSCGWKAVYLNFRHKIRELDKNWRSGKYFEQTFLIEDEQTECASDQYLINVGDDGHVLYDRRNLEIVNRIRVESDCEYSLVVENLFFHRDEDHTLRIFEAASGNLVFISDESEYVDSFAYKSGILALICSRHNGSELQIYRERANDFELLCEITFDGRTECVNIDERYITIFDRPLGKSTTDTIYFISTSHFNIEESFKISEPWVKSLTTYHYDRGIFFVIQDSGIIRLFEVSSGKWVRVIHHLPRKTTILVGNNSKYMVALAEESDYRSKLYIYDLVAAMDPYADSDGLLVTIIDVPNFQFYTIQVNEHEIYGVCPRSDISPINVYLKSFNFLVTESGHNVIERITENGPVIRPEI